MAENALLESQLVPDKLIMQGEKFDGTHFIVKNPPTDTTTTVVVFVHGIGMYHTCFNPLAQHLFEAGQSFILYDLIGRGFSDGPRSFLYDEGAHLSQLLDLLNHIKSVYPSVKKFDLAGHSMGGCISALFAAKHPAYVRSLMLFAPAGLMNGFSIDIIRSLTCMHGIIRNAVVGKKQLLAACKRDIVLTTDEANRLRQELVDDMSKLSDQCVTLFDSLWKSVLQFPLANADKQISELPANLPVLMIWAKQDVVIPTSTNMPAWTKLLKSIGIEPQVTVLEPAGHFVIIDHHQAIAEKMMAFLQALTPVIVEVEASKSEENAVEEEKEEVKIETVSPPETTNPLGKPDNAIY
jgi:pimeloyl-ACP methyl ester carboxylesterase